MVVKAAPAMPAIPQPSENVTRSTRFVSMPTAPLMARFCTVARTCRPQVERNNAKSSPPVSRMLMDMTNRPLMGMSTPSSGCQEPISQSGSVGLTSRGPNSERSVC
ncbi:hypothetical protein D3C87_1687830 [compost metagenome]